MIQIHPSQKSKLKRVTFKTLFFWNICTNIPVTSPSEHSRPAFLAPPQAPPHSLRGGGGPQWLGRSGEGPPSPQGADTGAHSL